MYPGPNHKRDRHGKNPDAKPDQRMSFPLRSNDRRANQPDNQRRERHVEDFRRGAKENREVERRERERNDRMRQSSTPQQMEFTAVRRQETSNLEKILGSFDSFVQYNYYSNAPVGIDQPSSLYQQSSNEDVCSEKSSSEISFDKQTKPDSVKSKSCTSGPSKSASNLPYHNLSGSSSIALKKIYQELEEITNVQAPITPPKETPPHQQNFELPEQNKHIKSQRSLTADAAKYSEHRLSGCEIQEAEKKNPCKQTNGIHKTVSRHSNSNDSDHSETEESQSTSSESESSSSSEDEDKPEIVPQTQVPNSPATRVPKPSWSLTELFVEKEKDLQSLTQNNTEVSLKTHDARDALDKSPHRRELAPPIITKEPINRVMKGTPLKEFCPEQKEQNKKEASVLVNKNSREDKKNETSSPEDTLKSVSPYKKESHKSSKYNGIDSVTKKICRSISPNAVSSRHKKRKDVNKHKACSSSEDSCDEGARLTNRKSPRSHRRSKLEEKNANRTPRNKKFSDVNLSLNEEKCTSPELPVTPCKQNHIENNSDNLDVRLLNPKLFSAAAARFFRHKNDISSVSLICEVPVHLVSKMPIQPQSIFKTEEQIRTSPSDDGKKKIALSTVFRGSKKRTNSTEYDRMKKKCKVENNEFSPKPECEPIKCESKSEKSSKHHRKRTHCTGDLEFATRDVENDDQSTKPSIKKAKCERKNEPISEIKEESPLVKEDCDLKGSQQNVKTPLSSDQQSPRPVSSFSSHQQNTQESPRASDSENLFRTPQQVQYYSKNDSMKSSTRSITPTYEEIAPAAPTTNNTPGLQYRSYLEKKDYVITRVNKSFMDKAKDLKRIADKLNPKEGEVTFMHQLLTYLEAGLYFILTCKKMEDEGPTPTTVCMYNDTLNFIRHVTSIVFRKEHPLEIDENLRLQLAVLSLRCTALLNMKLYNLNGKVNFDLNDLGKNMGDIVKTLSKQSEVTLPANSPASLSETPSPAGSEGSQSSSGYGTDGHNKPIGGQFQPSTPQPSNPTGYLITHAMLTLMQSYYKISNYLASAHKNWNEAEDYIYTHGFTESEFFISLDRECGPLTIFSDTNQLVSYVRKALDLIQEQCIS